MTTRLFFDNDTLAADVNVLSCTPDGEQFALILQETIFHPQGGGQPSDIGSIGGSPVYMWFSNKIKWFTMWPCLLPWVNSLRMSTVNGAS